MDKKKLYWIVSCIFLAIYLWILYNISKSILFNRYFTSLSVTYYFRMLIVLSSIVSVIIFMSSKFKRSNLFRVMLCIEVSSFPFTFFWVIYYYFLFKPAGGLYQSSPSLYLYISLTVDVILFVASCVGLYTITKEKTARLTYQVNEHNERVAFFNPVSAVVRFGNRCTDAAVIFYSVNILGEMFAAITRGGFQRSLSASLLLGLPYLIIYYLMLEGIFKTTAGKCATGTVIVNENGERPSFGQTVIRTFSRLIPFEAFSFFAKGARGWHDSLSKTYVVEGINTEDAALDDIILDAELNIFES